MIQVLPEEEWSRNETPSLDSLGVSRADSTALPAPTVLPAPAILPAPTVLPAPTPGFPGQLQKERCPQCEGRRPEPQPSGNLQVDPEIRLPSPGIPVEVANYYNAVSQYNGPYGFGRSISVNQLCQASGTPTVVTITRGDGGIATYQDMGGASFTCFTPGQLQNTLVKDVPDSLWKETTEDGITTAYPLNTAGMVTSVSYRQDAAGNTHSYLYNADGTLKNMQDGPGRLVTFGYSGGVLQSIQDWGGGRTTFQYDTASVPGKPLRCLTLPGGRSPRRTRWADSRRPCMTLHHGW